MRFLVDAQLPRRLVHQLRDSGHDAVHTLELPDGNRTTDAEISDRAERERRVVVTKDADFVNSFLLSGLPPKLLLVSTGNIGNRELEALFLANMAQIVEALETSSYVELSRAALIVHI